jgi:hypothetical protein
LSFSSPVVWIDETSALKLEAAEKPKKLTFIASGRLLVNRAEIGQTTLG